MRRREKDRFCELFGNGSGGIAVDSLFSDNFMREYTRFYTVEDMLLFLHVEAANMDGLADAMATLPDDEIYLNTEFGCWDEMFDTACDYYLARNMS